MIHKPYHRVTRFERWLKALLYPLMHLQAGELDVALVILSLILILNWWFGLQ